MDNHSRHASLKVTENAPVNIDTNNVIGKPIVTKPWEDIDTVWRQAEETLALGDLKRAHVFFVRLVELDPQDPRGWVGLGASGDSVDERIISLSYALALSDNSETRQNLRALVDQKLDNTGIADVPVLIALGRTLSEVGQRGEAYRILVHATELDPTNLDSWLWRASVADKNSEVLACLNQMLTIDPNNQLAKTGIDWIKRQRAARPTPVSIVDVNKASTLFEKGQSAFQAGRIGQAHSYFKRAAEADPTNETAWFWCGSTASTTDEAIACMERALKINPKNQSAKDARWYYKVKKFREQYPTPPTKPIQPEKSAKTDSQPKRWWFMSLIFTLTTMLARGFGITVT